LGFRCIIKTGDKMKQYIQLINHVLEHGEARIDRTQTGTIGTFGYQMRFNLAEGFPLLTTKRVHFPSVLIELLWFLKGDTNIKYLVDHNVRIWNEWPYRDYQQHPDYQGETLLEFVTKIKNDDEFAKKQGNLGPVYGKQWRDFYGVDQIAKVIESIQSKPTSRRHIVSAWNPAEVDQMALPPCHTLMQFYVSHDNTRLSLQLYQRSADVFLGVPFNIASYALLLQIVADVVALEPHEFVHSFGDVHIYNDHLEQVNLQRTRKPKALPQVIIKNHHDRIEDYEIDDFELVGYEHHPHIKGKVSV
jgi:thymidylate synthase